MDCIFCKIANKEIPTKFVYEDDSYAAFNDINPKAPTHILIIPKKHIESFHNIYLQQDKDLVKGLFDVAWKIIEDLEIKWCQLHINSGNDHWQEVMHVHLHLVSQNTTNIVW